MPVTIADRGVECLLVCDRCREGTAKLIKKAPLQLLSVGNRHLVEHQLEWLGDQGFKDISFSMSDRMIMTEEYVGKGARWGVKAEYSQDPQFLAVKDILKKHLPEGERPGLLVQDGSCVLRFDFPEELNASALFISDGELLPLVYLTKADLDLVLEKIDGANVLALCEGIREHIPRIQVLDVKAFHHHLIDVDRFLAMKTDIEEHPDIFQFLGSTRQEGVRIGRMTHISSKAQLKGPALIGDGSFIKAEAEIGPGAFIGDRSFIERGARIVNSIVAPETYIGRNTTFENKYVAGNYVLDLTGSSSIFVDDPRILGDLSRPMRIGRTAERVGSMMVFIAMLPLILLLMPLHLLLRGKLMAVERILEQPVKRTFTGAYDYHWCNWHHFDFGLFIIDFLPSLFDVAMGRLALVGNPPLTEAELMQLDDMWKGERIRGKAGCTGLVQQLDPETTNADDVFATTIYYNATWTLERDFRIFFKALLPGPHRFRVNALETE